MKVQDATKNNTTLLNVYSSLSPLKNILKFFGLYRISLDGNDLTFSRPNWKIAFPLSVFLILNCYSIYSKFINFCNTDVTFHDYVPIIYLCGYVQFIVDLVFVYKYGRQRCLDYYSTFKHIDETLGMPYYKEIKRSVGIICIYFFFVGFLTLITDYFSWTFSYGWFVASVHSIDYIYVIIKLLTALDAIAHSNQLRYRLKTITDILECYYCNVGNLPGVTKNAIFSNNWTKPFNLWNRLDFLKTIGFKHPNVISSLSRCYLLLLEQCDYMNGMFGFRVLLGGLVYLLDMVMLMNVLIRLISGRLVTYYASGCLPLVSIAMKIVYYVSILLCGINSCEQNYKETEKIVRLIDHLLVNKKLTMEIYDALKELKDLIITRPINFSALKFYNLDYPALLSMASAIVTYTIILLQNLK